MHNFYWVIGAGRHSQRRRYVLRCGRTGVHRLVGDHGGREALSITSNLLPGTVTAPAFHNAVSSVAPNECPPTDTKGRSHGHSGRERSLPVSRHLRWLSTTLIAVAPHRVTGWRAVEVRRGGFLHTRRGVEQDTTCTCGLQRCDHPGPGRRKHSRFSWMRRAKTSGAKLTYPFSGDSSMRRHCKRGIIPGGSRPACCGCSPRRVHVR